MQPAPAPALAASCHSFRFCFRSVRVLALMWTPCAATCCCGSTGRQTGSSPFAMTRGDAIETYGQCVCSLVECCVVQTNSPYTQSGYDSPMCACLRSRGAIICSQSGSRSCGSVARSRYVSAFSRLARYGAERYEEKKKDSLCVCVCSQTVRRGGRQAGEQATVGQ